MELDILLYPSEALKTPCYPVKLPEHKEALLPVLEEMKRLLAHYHGVGLAANQIGLVHYLFIMRESPETDIKIIINPNILHYFGSQISTKEGCLSIPGISAHLQCRYNHIKVEYQNLDGETIQEELTGPMAQIFQHEFDHVNGILMFDRMGQAQREIKKAKYKKILKKVKKFKDIQKSRT